MLTSLLVLGLQSLVQIFRRRLVVGGLVIRTLLIVFLLENILFLSSRRSFHLLRYDFVIVSSILNVCYHLFNKVLDLFLFECSLDSFFVIKLFIDYRVKMLAFNV